MQFIVLVTPISHSNAQNFNAIICSISLSGMREAAVLFFRSRGHLQSGATGARMEMRLISNGRVMPNPGEALLDLEYGMTIPEA